LKIKETKVENFKQHKIILLAFSTELIERNQEVLNEAIDMLLFHSYSDDYENETIVLEDVAYYILNNQEDFDFLSDNNIVPIVENIVLLSIIDSKIINMYDTLE
jgi:hypothetical protein